MPLKKVGNSLQNDSEIIQSLLYKWRSRTLYTGPSYTTRKRQYSAHALIIDFNDEFSIYDTEFNECIHTRMALIPMGTDFVMNTKSNIFSVFYLDLYGLDFTKLVNESGKQSGHIYHDFDETWVAKICDILKNIYLNVLPINEAEVLLDALGFDRRTDVFDRVGELEGVDPRLTKVIDMFIDGKLSLSTQAGEVARIAGLSRSHLNNLFRQYMGGNFTTFRIQLQFHCYLMARSFGKSQSDAVLEAGFVDQAHFCKRFKQALGIKSKDYYAKNIKRYYFTDPEILKRYLSEGVLYGALT